MFSFISFISENGWCGTVGEGGVPGGEGGAEAQDSGDQGPGIHFFQARPHYCKGKKYQGFKAFQKGSGQNLKLYGLNVFYKAFSYQYGVLIREKREHL